MHIRTLTKRSPDAAQTDAIVFLLDVVSAIVSVISQINSLIVNVRAKESAS